MKDSIFGIIRHGLTAAAGYFTANGIAAEDELQAIVAGIMAAIGVAWSLYDKKTR